MIAELKAQLAQSEQAFFAVPFQLVLERRSDGSTGAPLIERLEVARAEKISLTLTEQRTTAGALVNESFTLVVPSIHVVIALVKFALLSELFATDYAAEQGSGALTESWSFSHGDTRLQKTFHEPFPPQLAKLREQCTGFARQVRTKGVRSTI